MLSKDFISYSFSKQDRGREYMLSITGECPAINNSEYGIYCIAINLSLLQRIDITGYFFGYNNGPCMVYFNFQRLVEFYFVGDLYKCANGYADLI
jgi:hypothetical protein